MSWGRFLFGLHGRINRLQALTGLYGVGLASMALFFIGALLFGPVADGGGFLIAGPFAVFVVSIYLIATVSQVTMFVRRAHDVGLSGWVVFWWSAIALGLNFFVATTLPIASVVVVLPMVLAAFWMLLSPGQPATNRFGEPPRPGWLP